MDLEKDYVEVNRKLWNERTNFHLKSDFYAQENFIKTQSSLQAIELGLLGEVAGKSILHLQCHFGQDTLSLSKMGAIVTGVDFSENAIETARRLAGELNLPARFIASDIYNLPSILDDRFDIIFTSYGVIGWLPDLDKWAACIAHFLKPGGRFVFAEFHPFVWMFDDHFDQIVYSYFKDTAIIETEQGTYADKDAGLCLPSVSWNHSVSEVLNALITHGMTILRFEEFNFSPYNCFKSMQATSEGQYNISKFGNKVPLVYALTAKKNTCNESTST